MLPQFRLPKIGSKHLDRPAAAVNGAAGVFPQGVLRVDGVWLPVRRDTIECHPYVVRTVDCPAEKGDQTTRQQP